VIYIVFLSNLYSHKNGFKESRNPEIIATNQSGADLVRFLVAPQTKPILVIPQINQK
jgi:hypothetical protein